MLLILETLLYHQALHNTVYLLWQVFLWIVGVFRE